MSKLKPIVFIFIILLSALFAYGWCTLPTSKDQTYEGFSSERVVNDLQVIAKEPHSVAHPEARIVVRDYLKQRLESFGEEVHLYHYPACQSKGFTFDTYNLLAEFPPLKSVKDTTYLMMVAHYDSKYPVKWRGETISSFGAADDGYGLGVILENLNQVLKFRKEWNQGIKVLFTDAEEVSMIGMKLAYQQNKEIFENVGLIINLEARGTYGPVLLFETSPGNERLMELYENHARYPYTYSLTSAIYKFMPNFTDFSIVKDSIPGFNFSVVADINHYHTDWDNLNNISESSIQHYGEQILPILQQYLINPQYNDKHYFQSENDTIFFTIPLLGYLHFSQTGYWVLNICIWVVFLWLLVHTMKKESFKTMGLLKHSGKLLLLLAGTLAVGELIAWLCTLTAGIPFTPFGTITGIPYDNIVMAIAVAVMLAVIAFYYYKQRLY
ncbi:MAG: M28 family peptidase, partial [Parabacteroides sp.]|nr:M28 family peptidase [Parabacteroides sp.]